MIISLPAESKARELFKKIKINLIEFSKTEKTLYSEVIFIVKTFFFVYLGMKMSSFNFSLEIVIVFLKSLVLTLAIFLVRYLILALFRKNKEGNNLLLAMIPKGLAAAVLISMIKDADQSLIFLTYGVILNSIFLSSIIIYMRERGKTIFSTDKDNLENLISEDIENLSSKDSKVTDNEGVK